MDTVFDLCKNFSGIDTTGGDKNFTFPMTLNPFMWDGFSVSKEPNHWECIKYMTPTRKETKKFKDLTTNHGGVFIWMIQPEKKIHIPSYSYVAYIGMSDANLKSSVTQFKNNISRCSGRLSDYLFEDYSSYLYLLYVESDDKKYNKELLEALVNAVQPPIKEMTIDLDETSEEDAF